MKKLVAILLLLLLVGGCGKSDQSAQQQSGADKPVNKQPNNQLSEGTEQSNKVHMPEPNQYQAIKVLLEVEAETFSYETYDEDVVELCLHAAKITTEELACLTRLRKLESLDLIRTNVTDTGLAYLEGLVKLKSLDLSDTQITDTGLEHLKKLTKLKMLNLRETEVTDAGVADLQKALPDCEISH